MYRLGNVAAFLEPVSHCHSLRSSKSRNWSLIVVRAPLLDAFQIAGRPTPMASPAN